MADRLLSGMYPRQAPSRLDRPFEYPEVMPNRPVLGRTIPCSAFLPVLLVLAFGCQGPVPNRDPVGETFPQVKGRDLDRDTVELPGEIAGSPAILLVGYLQDTQFDIDRWTLGLLQADCRIRVLEIPAVTGWFPEMFLQPTIDEGMRAGIPPEDWAAVVTLYGEDADRLQQFTGTERARNARVLLVDPEGRVAWFWDRGFSPARLLEMLATRTSKE